MKVKLKEEILERRKLGLSYKKIKQELGCSLSVISYHCRRENLDNPNILKIPSIQQIEEFNTLYNEGKGCAEIADIVGFSRPTVQKYIKRKRIRKQTITRVESVVNWRRRTKEKLVEYKGGKCENCGYSKHLEVLQFHHLDPKEKDFTIGGKSWSFERLKGEVDKCSLLCANCHIEEHTKLRGA